MRLLSHSIRIYLILSVVLLLLSVPAFYLVIHQLFIRQLDAELRDHQQDFFRSVPFIRSHTDLQFYELVNEEFELTEINAKPGKDSIYTQQLYDAEEKKSVPFRILRSYVTVGGKNYVLLIKESMIETREFVVAIVAVKSGFLLVLLVSLFIVNRSFTKKLWQPFYHTLSSLKNFDVKKHTQLSVGKSTISEFDDLNRAVTSLAERTYAAFTSQKEFTENAAHELQTPIAICRTKLELLMQTNLTADQAELVNNLYHATDRITRLSKNLLLLSQIESKQFVGVEVVSLSQVILRILEIYNAQISQKNLKIKTVLGELSIKGNAALADILVNNLISNSIRYSSDGGEIVIELGRETLTISNPGPPLKDPGKIFERFHRETAYPYGSGLGLAIVKKICEAEGHDIRYSYDSGYHRFTVTFQL